MTDFLLELLCEEMPARMQVKASDDLARLFAEALAGAGLKAERIDSFVTPRRLALIARGLPLETAAVSEEHKGPRTSAPAQALEGFLRKTGLRQDQLEDRDGVWFAVVEKPGRATADVLAQAIPAIVRAFPWPKSMRWGTASQTTESLRWVRPLQGIVALLGDMIVDVEVDDIRSGNVTRGHRFHHPDPVTIAGPDAYVDALRGARVIADHHERMAIIAAKAGEAAAAHGLTLVEDKGLVAENAGLTEWPVPLLGDFDPDFLEVPPEVIQLTLRTNQKYFVLRDASGKLAPAFVCTANIEAIDGGAAIVAGNRKVLAARLSDARFFWEQDKKTPLAEHAKKLERITFHEKLGTVADKVERVAKLARWLVDEGIVTDKKSLPFRGGVGVGTVDDVDAVPASLASPTPGPSPEGEGSRLADLAEQAARLCKADLVTEMVGEFPELQGIMGGYYARAQGLPDAVADAIRDHYKPVGQGDDVPTAPVTVAVSLADKLDTITQFFAIDLPPTGSKDPFALRRSALGVMSLIQSNGLRFSIRSAIVRMIFFRVIAEAHAPYDAIAQQIKDAGDKLAPTELLEELARSFSKTGIAIIKQAKPELLDKSWVILQSILDFFADRLKVQQREAGVRHDLIDAVFALGGEDDLVRLLARVKALQAFVETAEGANLLAGYKRAANILKKEGASPSTSVIPAPSSVIPAQAGTQGASRDSGEDGEMGSRLRGNDGDVGDAAHLGYDAEPAEVALIAALEEAEPRAKSAIAAEDFAGAMAALASLRAPIDAFFETVTVKDPDPAKRTARLALLARMRDAVHGVADFSRIEG
ncbi:glycine--tRNA ligase subunit beta [Sphingobium algorifonticola]|uniref:Glycine--tRNA ligase beta subunit n=1 Tax=Sphingobium algorifonticola TaxID=2008318 RepID=A0A437J809_9SPHN|nr:glycine--tRNA ligase subunit beta [Sphingobium algorifonticola]RVT41144.1 glycine--tRNA ligase subunit beta [Sphingobium algorifonticola]